jgi:short-subunit dehydrogenase
MNLPGSVVLITGASEGIGAACAREFRSRGAKLALLARNETKLRQVAQPGELVIVADLTDPATRRRAIAETEAHYGRIDVLVNNAGVGLYSPAWQAPMNQVRQMFELNVFALLELTQLAVTGVNTGGMKQRGTGTIVNVSSIGGKVPLAWFTAYSGSKFAVSSMTAGLRMELKQYGVHVMDVCPGYVKTGFQQNTLAGEAPAQLWRARRFSITAEECAKALANGVERGQRTVVTPWLGRMLMAGFAVVPGIMEHFMERLYRGLNMDKAVTTGKETPNAR